MKLSSPLPLFFLLLLTTGYYLGGIEASLRGNSKVNKNEINGFRPTKLFVFGDSYADTGNNRKSTASSWKQPYGLTFPGKPAGRFSDGRILTDFLAKYLGVKSPIPYRMMKYGKHRLQYGVNFAYGGTGVFDTLVPEPNMTQQIGFFIKLLEDSVYTKSDVESSLFLVTLAGNDYGAYVAKGGTNEGLPGFISRVVNQLAANLKRIQSVGAKKVAVTTLPPLGCFPRTTVSSSFRQCNDSQNLAVTLHNSLLQQALKQLNNNQTKSKAAPFVVLDLFSSFTTLLLHPTRVRPESRGFSTPLKPCCEGISDVYSCGSLDDKGMKMYTLCKDPNAAFFWDGVHPTQAGWRAVYTVLQSTLQQIF